MRPKNGGYVGVRRNKLFCGQKFGTQQSLYIPCFDQFYTVNIGTMFFSAFSFMPMCITLVCILLYLSIMTHCNEDYCYKALMWLYVQTQYNVGPTFTFLTHCGDLIDRIWTLMDLVGVLC